MKKAIVIVLVLLIFIPLSAKEVRAQPRYIVAVNFRITFKSDGTAIVSLLQHPFNISKKGFEDLYGNPSILQDMVVQEERTAAGLVLLFADNPEKVDYEIVGNMRMKDDEVVLCDVENIGEMKELKGAIVLDVLVHLETTNAIEQLNDRIYRIRITDCYTRLNPMSWIDVIEFRMGEDVQLISYKWSPKSAKGPKIAEDDRLLWENFNEPEAPNEYILELKLPRFELKGAKGYEVMASSSFSNGLLHVSLTNVGNDGFFYIRAVGDSIDQVRKVYLRKGESANLSFPAPKKVKVEIWHESTMLGEAKWVEEVERGTHLKSPSITVLAVIVMGLVLIFLSFLVEKEPRKPETIKDIGEGFGLVR